MKKRIVYVAHPIGGDVSANLKHLFQCLNYISRKYPDVIPVAPYIGDVMSLDDSDPKDRKRGLANGKALIETGIFEEIWLTGDAVTAGMGAELTYFINNGKPIVNLIGKIDVAQLQAV